MKEIFQIKAYEIEPEQFWLKISGSKIFLITFLSALVAQHQMLHPVTGPHKLHDWFSQQTGNPKWHLRSNIKYSTGGVRFVGSEAPQLQYDVIASSSSSRHKSTIFRLLLIQSKPKLTNKTERRRVSSTEAIHCYWYWLSYCHFSVDFERELFMWSCMSDALI